MVICLDRGSDLHMAQLMPLPLTVCCFSKIQIGFAFLVPAHPGSPGKRAVKRVCACVCVRACVCVCVSACVCLRRPPRDLPAIHTWQNLGPYHSQPCSMSMTITYYLKVSVDFAAAGALWT